MISKEEVIIEVIEERITEINCDCCGEKLITNKEDDEDLGVAHLTFFKGKSKLIQEDGPIDCPEQESSDFCETCYVKIKKFLINLGAKIPSYYSNSNQKENLFIDMFFGDDNDEEE